MNEKCRGYTEAHLTEGMYCNTENCIYKIEPHKGKILPNCSVDGKFDGPCLDEEVRVLSDEHAKYFVP